MILGIAGKARSGKDTAANMINSFLRAYNREFEMYSFAKPLKDAVCEIFKWGDNHRDGALKEVQLYAELDLRTLAITIYKHCGSVLSSEECYDMGSKFIEAISNNAVFSCADGNTFKTCISPRQAFQWFGTDAGRAVRDSLWLDLVPFDKDVIIPDVRFDNESEFIHNNDGFIIHISRSSVGDGVVSGHVSESGVTPLTGDVFVVNDKDLNSLEKKLQKIAQSRLFTIDLVD